MADKTEEEQKLLDLLKLKRSLEKAELKDTEQYVTTVKQIEVLQAKVKEHQKGILKYFGDTNKAAAALKGSLMEMGNSLKQIGSIWVATDFTNIGTTLLKQNVEIEKSLHRTLVNSGKFGPSLREAKKDVIGLRTQFGATYQEAAAVVKTLSEKQYIGNLKEAADSSFLFARATGMGKDEVAELTVALQKEGKISGKATTAMYADLLKIQQSNGMTKEGMKATTNQIVKMSAQMRAFGKSEGEIRQMAAATGRLVSSFEKVGISAQEATQWIDKMLDPEKIEENIASYAALGISMTDALTGNIDQGQLETGLKEFGEKVKAMGPIAGKAYAQAMGISYSMAIKATDAEKATEEALTPEESAAKSLETLTDATQSFHEKISETFNKLEGTLQGLPNGILAALGVLGPQIGKAVGAAISSVFKKVENDAASVSERIAKQFEKGSLNTKDVMQTSFDELFSHLDGQSNEVAEEMYKQIGDAFAKISKTSNGQKWFVEQKLGIDSVVKSLEEQKLKMQASINAQEVVEQKLKTEISLLTKKGNLSDSEKKNLNDMLSKRLKLTANLNKEKNEREKISKEIQRQNNLQKSMNNLLDAGGIKLSKFQLNKQKSAGKLSGFGSKIGGAVGKAKTKLANSKIGGFAGKVVGVAGGVGGAIGNVLKVLGPIGIVVGVIGALLKKSEKFQKMLSDINKKVVEPIMKQIGEIFDQIDWDAITDVLCSLLPIVLKIIKIAMLPILWAVKLITAGINKILSIFNKSIKTEEQIAENTSDDSSPMDIRTSTDGGVRTYNTSNSSETRVNTSETISEKKQQQEKNAEVTRQSFNELPSVLRDVSTALESIKGYLQGDGGRSVADSIRIGMDGVTLNVSDGSGIKPANIKGPYSGDIRDKN